jgi:hypothetical protein
MLKKDFFRYLLLAAVLSVVCISCGKKISNLEVALKKYGYIPYATPLESAGPGTLIGGRPSQLSLIAPSNACFPEEFANGESTHLHVSNSSELPTESFSFSTTDDANVQVLNFLKDGTGVIDVGAGFNMVSQMDLEMDGVSVESLDSIALTQYFESSMNPVCKQYLEQSGFIIQALKVSKLSFKFVDKTGANIKVDLPTLKQIVNLSAGLNFHIEEGTTLVIERPTYLGYQLGSLRQQDHGFALYRASQVERDRFIFQSLNVFTSAPLTAHQ